MRLSTRSRYGTRMVLDLARRYNNGPTQIGEIAGRQNVSVKYLEQLIIPLKKAGFIESVRGPKGGHMLARSPERITLREVVEVLEGGLSITECVGHPGICEKSADCPTRRVWRDITQAMNAKLDSITLADMI